MINNFYDFTACGGSAVEATWIYCLLDASIGKGEIRGEMDWAADGADIDSKEAPSASQHRDAYEHGDLLPTLWPVMVVREMNFLGEQAVDFVGLERESSPGTNATPT